MSKDTILNQFARGVFMSYGPMRENIIIIVSSANMYGMDESTESGKSLIYTTKRRGPKILFWGTPERTSQ